MHTKFHSTFMNQHHYGATNASSSVYMQCCVKCAHSMVIYMSYIVLFRSEFIYIAVGGSLLILCFVICNLLYKIGGERLQ